MNKINVFENLNEVYECYGEENVIPVTNIKQIIYYTSVFHLQPEYIDESVRNKGQICCYFHKGKSKKPYMEWMKNRPMNVKEVK